MALVPVLDGHHQLPLLVHRDRILKQRVEDVDAEESGQVDVSEADQHIGGELADHQEGGRGGEQLWQVGARARPIASCPNADWEWVAAELREQLSEGNEKKRQQLT